MQAVSQTDATLWVEVEDFFFYFASNPRPSGIQRFAFELMQALVQAAGPERVRFVRRAGNPGALLAEVQWAEVAAMFDRQRLAVPRSETPTPALERRRRVRQMIEGLPEHLRDPLFRAGVAQLQAYRSWREAGRALRRRRVRPGGQGAAPGSAAEPGIRPGDRYLVLGSPWAIAGSTELIGAIKRRYGVVAEVLLHDLIPVRHPEWCGKLAVMLFSTWLEANLPLFDRIMTNSRHTAGDVAAYAAEQGVRLAGPVQPVPVGTSFGGGLEPVAAPPSALPALGSYVLFVSTLEVRKNHDLAVRVWRKLDDEVRAGTRRAESVPTLVFAGKIGTLVGDLLQQLDSMHWLRGRIRLIRDPSDAELRALYDGCLFSFVPSWFEGWGLPVSESLVLGKPCLASSATAIPEAGGALCRYFDPGDVGGAHRAVAAVLDDPAGLAAWQERVRREFRPTSWAATARAVLEPAAEFAE